MTAASSLVVQTVLWGNDVAWLRRWVGALRESVGYAASAGLIGRSRVSIGDCSPVPVLSPDVVAELTELCAPASLGYRHFGANVGHGAGHDALREDADEDLVLMLNPDALIGTPAIAELVRSVRAGAALTDARQVPLEHPKSYDPATGDTSWASGACLLADRAVLDAVGGFDSESFFLYGDDVDLSWRVRLAGHRVVHTPAAAVFHDKRLDPDAGLAPGSVERHYSAESRLLLAHKYSRPDRLDSVARAIRAGGDPDELRALDAFEERRRDGRLPVPLDARHEIGQFVGTEFAEHRF